jgi:purine-cytosine permease-like protein
VPPADVPPPPGYETSVSLPVSQAQPEPQLSPEPVDDSPASPDRPPQRRSLDDEELLRTLKGADQTPGATLDAIEQLQAELQLRDREAKQFAAWELSMMALGTPDAVAAVDGVRPEFSDLVGPAPLTDRPLMDERLADEPLVDEPPTDEPPARTEATAQVQPPWIPPTLFAPDEPVSVVQDLPAPAVDDEPSLEGTAFDDLFSSGDAEPQTEPPVQFPGHQEDAGEPDVGEPATRAEDSRFAPPALIEPPPPGDSRPDVSDAIGLASSFGGPIGEPLAEADSEPAPSEEILAQPIETAAPEPATPEPFDALLTGEQDGESPPGAPLPFGNGVARDDALDPFSRISGGSLGPVSVNTSGIAVIGGSIEPEPEPELLAEADAPTDDHPFAVVAPTPETAAQRIFVPEAAGEEPTPLDYRVGRAARLFWLWFASNSSIVAVVFGGIIFSLGMSLRQAIVATLAGVALSFIPLGLGTLAGKRSGQPTMVISRATFGVVGNVVPAAIGLLSRLFWGAALLWLVGAGTASILTGAGATDGFSEQQLTFILMVIGFILVLVCACYGYALIARVQLIVSILSGIFIVGFIALTSGHIDLTTALTTGDGSWVLAVAGAVLVFSFVGLVWANSSSDLARYQRSGSSGAGSMLWATFGTALPSFVLIAYGALLAASDPKVSAGLLKNPLNELGHLLPGWYPAPLLAASALSLLSGAVLSIYSGGFALQSVGLRIPRRFATLVVGILVLVVALVLTISVTNFTELFRDFSTTLAVLVAAWAGIFGAEIMIRNRRLDSGSLTRRGGVYADVRWGNLGALVVIVVIGLGFTSATVGWLSWEGYLFTALGVPLNGELAGSDLGVLVALLLGLAFPIVAGVPAVRRQESAGQPAE